VDDEPATVAAASTTTTAARAIGKEARAAGASTPAARHRHYGDHGADHESVSSLNVGGDAHGRSIAKAPLVGYSPTMSWPQVRPRVLFSRCLEGDACRYDGDRVPDAFIGQLRRHVEAVDICPEVAIGLGVPRPPIRLLAEGRLVEPSTGRDLTRAMQTFTADTVRQMTTLDGVVLKSRSPSCGLGDTRLYSAADAEESSDLGHGLFACGIEAAFGDLAVSDEVRLSDASHRRGFLERLFTLAWLRDRAADRDAGLLPQLRRLLARDEPLHRGTLGVALTRSDSEAVRTAIAEALALGPATGAPVAPLAALPELYPPELS